MPLPSGRRPTPTPQKNFARSTPTPEQEFRSELRLMTQKGWVVVNEGPSGAQLKKPRTLSFVTGLLILLGVASVFFNYLGTVAFLAIAALNYAMTPDKTRFLPRPRE